MRKDLVSSVLYVVSSVCVCILCLLVFNSEVLASEEIFYIHSDHLGSTSVITQNGTKVDETKYYPYGTGRVTSPQALGNSPSTGSGLSAQISEKGYTG